MDEQSATDRSGSIDFDQGRWRVANISVRSITKAHSSVLVADRPSATVVDKPVGAALLACAELKTLAEHAEAIVRAQPAFDPALLRELLTGLASAGLFESEPQIVERCLSAASEPAKRARIDHVAAVACDRPEMLERWATSVLSACGLHDRRPVVSVLDDTSDPDARQRQRATLARLSRESGVMIRYAGLEEKRDFAAALVAEGAPEPAVAAALFDVRGVGVCTGANRNALSLAHAGTPVLSMDDDTVLRLARVPESRDVVALDSRLPPVETWFFEDRDQALAAVSFDQADPFAPFEQVLGQPASALCREGFDGSHVSREMVRSLEQGLGSVVVASTGVVGDSGVGDPSPWLTLPSGPTRRRMLASLATYRAAFTRKEVVRGATSLAISDKPYLMAPAIALDLRRTLPPFPPVGRNQDGVFALALGLSVEAGYVAHLPWAVAHLPPCRTYQTGAPGFTLDAMIQAAITASSTARLGTTAERLDAMGTHLTRLSSAPEGHFREWLEHQRQARISRTVQLLEQRLEEHEERPRRWAEDAKARINTWMQSLVSERRLPVSGPAEGALALCRHVLSDYGSVLSAWPSLLAASQRLSSEGVLLAQAV